MIGLNFRDRLHLQRQLNLSRRVAIAPILNRGIGTNEGFEIGLKTGKVSHITAGSRIFLLSYAFNDSDRHWFFWLARAIAPPASLNGAAAIVIVTGNIVNVSRHIVNGLRHLNNVGAAIASVIENIQIATE
ncbi:hypothetical protein K9N68_09820 [Kovacikia minuta CCNUW1]|uniref:hypothetical protein n=1 Tax=Kovacikia minuta TaxID=2931930 RepID=UPI001CCB9BD5|nr:hypothetical protein [Kovacikia minuta]UBF29755.1 hypothetical protein K9N68_09820 [Kovacikia minuta CCNUW1]